MVHEAASKGFSRGAIDYEQGRPSYPLEALRFIVDELDLREGRTVVDIGAGTGKLTRLLVPSGAAVIAVEPVDEMLDILRRVVPEAKAVDGTAERIPVAAASADAVTAAQMFHWVDAVPAVSEVHRVLRPGGGFVLLWNSRDPGAGWTAAITKLMDSVAGDAPRYGSAAEGRWQAAVDEHGGFTEISQRTFRLQHPTTRDATLARVASTSYVSALPDEQRAAVVDEAARIVDAAGLGDTFFEPYVTELYWCRKR